MPLPVTTPSSKHSTAGFTRMNRTGATIAYGGVAIVDAMQAEAESTDIGLALHNLTAVTTALFKHACVVVCRETAGVADNAEGRFAESNDGAMVDVLVDSTTDIAKGDLLKCVNAAAYLVKATNGTDRPVARALEARTADTQGTIKCQLFSNGITAIA